MLVNEWRQVIRKAWSFHLSIAAGVLSSATAIMAVFLSPDSSVLYMAAFAGVSVVASIAGFAAAGARVVYQSRMHNDA